MSDLPARTAVDVFGGGVITVDAYPSISRTSEVPFTIPEESMDMTGIAPQLSSTSPATENRREEERKKRREDPHSIIYNTPREMIAKISRGNIKWTKKYAADFEENLHDILHIQHPKVTWLTCGDSRVPFSCMGIASPNEIFSVRNIGNQYKNSEGSVKYAILNLRTPIVIVMGHTGCGAIRASTSDYRFLDSAIQKEVVGLLESLDFAEYQINEAAKQENASPKLREARLDVISEINVDVQVQLILSDYKVKQLVDDGKLTVIGAMFDIHDVYKRGHGKVHIVNINGVTKKDDLKANEILSELDDHEREELVRRLFNPTDNYLRDMHPTAFVKHALDKSGNH
jgi:carbonic anhydrase